jgi:E3 ubiquitin-protein ligase MGRN1
MGSSVSRNGATTSNRRSIAENNAPLYGDPTPSSVGGTAASGQQYTQAQMQALYMSRGRADMGFIQSQLHSQFQQPAPELQETTTVRNHVNLKKHTLKLIDHQNGQYSIDFCFDSAKPCNILLYFQALESIDDDGNSSFTSQKPDLHENIEPFYVYPSQLGQKYTSPPFELSSWAPHEMVHAPNTNVFPLVVELQVANPHSSNSSHKSSSSSSTNTNTMAQKQSTFLHFSQDKHKNNNGPYKVHVLKQKVQVQGQTYELQEIYGIDGSIAAAPKSPTNGAAVASALNASAVLPDNSILHSAMNNIPMEGNTNSDIMDGGECIICLCAPRNTTILPCRYDDAATIDTRTTRLRFACTERLK